MTILQSLQFVRGAVAQKSHVPVLKHFQIKDGRIQSNNGVMSISAPIDCDLTVQPLAHTFVHAITLCEDTVALHTTDTGRLAVTSKNLKAYIDASSEEFPQVVPKGDRLEASGLLEAVKALAPIMGSDASRPWSRGILFAGNSAFVTNNIVLVEHWLKNPVSQPFGLPAMAVNELLRIGEEPEVIRINERNVTFYFEGDRWLSTTLLIIREWPDVRMMLKERNDGVYTLHDNLFTALQKLRPFTKDVRPVWLCDDKVSTSREENDGTHLTVEGCEGMRGVWSLDHLAKLDGVATEIFWDDYPKPCAFFGKVMRGIILGIRDA